MSPYAIHLAHARLRALHALIEALNQAETPAERRRCAVAILNAPDPSEVDDEIGHLDSDTANDETAPNSSVPLATSSPPMQEPDARRQQQSLANASARPAQPSILPSLLHRPISNLPAPLDPPRLTSTPLHAHVDRPP